MANIYNFTPHITLLLLLSGPIALVLPFMAWQGQPSTQADIAICGYYVIVLVKTL